MNKREKLVLAGILFLALGLGLGSFVKGLFAGQEAAGDPALQPQEARRVDTHQKWVELQNQAEVPEDLKRTEKYLRGRFGHLGDEGIVAVGSEKDGQIYEIQKHLIVARTGKGETVYAQGLQMTKKFTGPVAKFKDRMTPKAMASMASPKRGALERGLKPQQVPLEAFPGSLYGERGELK